MAWLTRPPTSFGWYSNNSEPGCTGITTEVVWSSFSHLLNAGSRGSIGQVLCHWPGRVSSSTATSVRPIEQTSEVCNAVPLLPVQRLPRSAGRSPCSPASLTGVVESGGLG